MNSMFEPTHFPQHIKLPTEDEMFFVTPSEQLKNMQRQLDKTHQEWLAQLKKVRPITDENNKK